MSFPKAPQQGRGGVGVEPRQVGRNREQRGPQGRPHFLVLPSGLMYFCSAPLC